jgi:GNAT superfamily N-acetyltransferase
VAASGLAIRPLDASSWDALSALFRQGGDPKWCWCAYWVVRGLDWTNSTADGNRALLHDRMANSDRGGPPGLVAFDGDEAVGWVSLGPRERFDRLASSKLLAPVDDTPVWSIVCFVVSRARRRQGVATALLDAAVAFAAEHGATCVEAYPVDTSEGHVPPASAYHGTLPMFERAGFAVVATRQWNATTRPRIIVRREVG